MGSSLPVEEKGQQRICDPVRGALLDIDGAGTPPSAPGMQAPAYPRIDVPSQAGFPS